jgi:hypothetical protein
MGLAQFEKHPANSSFSPKPKLAEEGDARSECIEKKPASRSKKSANHQGKPPANPPTGAAA